MGERCSLWRFCVFLLLVLTEIRLNLKNPLYWHRLYLSYLVPLLLEPLSFLPSYRRTFLRYSWAWHCHPDYLLILLWSPCLNYWISPSPSSLKFKRLNSLNYLLLHFLSDSKDTLYTISYCFCTLSYPFQNFTLFQVRDDIRSKHRDWGSGSERFKVYFPPFHID